MACRTAPMDSTCLPEMPRRAFVAIVSGGLLAAPLAAEAQQAGKVYRIGMLERTSPATNAANLEAFRRGLRELDTSRGRISSSSTDLPTAETNDTRLWRLS